MPTTTAQQAAIDAARRAFWRDPDPRPDRALWPCARVVRAALKAADLGHVVERVTTTRHACLIYLHMDEWDTGAAAAAAAALRPLWRDGNTRIRQNTGVVVHVSVPGWHEQPPADVDPSGRETRP